MDKNIALFEAMRGLRKQMEGNFENLAKELDITASELLVLLDIYLYPKTSLIDLCARTGMKKSSVSRIISRLEEKSLLTRATCPNSKREVELNVTETFLENDFCWNHTFENLFPNLKDTDTTLKNIEALTQVLTAEAKKETE